VLPSLIFAAVGLLVWLGVSLVQRRRLIAHQSALHSGGDVEMRSCEEHGTGQTESAQARDSHSSQRTFEFQSPLRTSVHSDNVVPERASACSATEQSVEPADVAGRAATAAPTTHLPTHPNTHNATSLEKQNDTKQQPLENTNP